MGLNDPSVFRRREEVDILRAVAVILMILFHLAFDLKLIYGLPGIVLHEGPLWLMGKAAAILFFLIFGVSLALSARKSRPAFQKILRRFTLLLFWAMMITLLTVLLFPDRPIIFGVLHFFAISTLLAPLFLRFYRLDLLFALACFAAGLLLMEVDASFWYLLPLGLAPARFMSIDYYPLLPWFGFILLGIFCGKALYEKRNIDISVPRFPGKSGLLFLGRHALFVYLVHQPVLILFLYGIHHLVL